MDICALVIKYVVIGKSIRIGYCFTLGPLVCVESTSASDPTDTGPSMRRFHSACILGP